MRGLWAALCDLHGKERRITGDFADAWLLARATGYSSLEDASSHTRAAPPAAGELHGNANAAGNAHKEVPP